MSHVLIIGYGNPLRCDDGFGWHFAQRLQQQVHAPEIEVIACHQLTPDLAERIRCADHVIFADASNEPMASELSLRKIEADPAGSANLTHHLNPQTLLAMARTLFGRCPRHAFLLTARAHELGFSAELSAQLTAVLDKAVERAVLLCEFLVPSTERRVTNNA